MRDWGLSETAAKYGDVPATTTVWTCSMHPQIRMSEPGRCPICGMELVPIEATRAAGTQGQHFDNHLELSEHARQMACVETVAIEDRKLFKEIRTVGKVDFDETRVAHIAAWVDGRVDEVFANFPGTPVKLGDHLVKIYSADLVTGQQEFLISHRHEQAPGTTGGTDVRLSLYGATRERLRRLGMTDAQLDELARSGEAQTHVVVHAPIGGTVIEKNIRAGQYVKQGDSLFTIADLRDVWLILEVYEYELSWVRFGQTVEVTLESEPQSKFNGTVGFIEPLLNEATRTVRVRVILKNDAGKFKPGMFAQALIRVSITANGEPAPTGLEGKYACPMHPYIVSDVEEKCSVCQMPLDLVPGDSDEGRSKTPPKVLAVPAEAVLTTGQRRLVYVEQQPGEYHMVEPKLGSRAGDYFPVLGGLEAGQRVVVRGNFLLDSQFQITGKPSLLYPEGIAGGGTGHAGHAMPQKSDTISDERATVPPKAEGVHKH
jgi:Cu(I)/Ag(I) efflux system membrane fusion protein